MLLRAYQVNPCSWEKILESIQENSHTLPSDAKALYSSATKKQLKDRLSTKTWLNIADTCRQNCKFINQV